MVSDNVGCVPFVPGAEAGVLATGVVLASVAETEAVAAYALGVDRSGRDMIPRTQKRWRGP